MKGEFCPYSDQLYLCSHDDCQRDNDDCVDCNNGDMYISPDREGL